KGHGADVPGDTAVVTHEVTPDVEVPDVIEEPTSLCVPGHYAGLYSGAHKIPPPAPPASVPVNGAVRFTVAPEGSGSAAVTGTLSSNAYGITTDFYGPL